MDRTCDFCGYESPPAPAPASLSADGFLELKPGQRPFVLRLKMEVDPGVRIADYEAKAVTYNVCTRCLFQFLQKQEAGL